jgi:hypothetical protein
MLSQSQIAAYWGPPCSGSRATVSLHGAGKVTVRSAIVEATKALNSCLITWNYKTRYADTGAFVCRQRVGGGGWSNHAYATAIDINWQLNPYGGSRHHIPSSLAAAICRIRTKNGRQVWNWGGYWSGTRDWMHFEIVCKPSDIATGINWNTVPGSTAPAPPPDWAAIRRWNAGLVYNDFIKLPNLDGSSPPSMQVGVLQNALNIVRNAGLKVDGHYGGATMLQVLAFQQDVNRLSPGSIKDFPGAAHKDTRRMLAIGLANIRDGKA